MSDKERAAALLECVPSYKLGYVVAYLQGLIADEEADELFCEKMYQEYLNDPIPIEDFAKQLGIT